MILTNRFSVCVCIAFVPFQWEITEIECLSCFGDFFVRFHIVCDRYTSDYDQITFSDTIWPLLLSPDFGTQMITLAETATYSMTGHHVSDKNEIQGWEHIWPWGNFSHSLLFFRLEELAFNQSLSKEKSRAQISENFNTHHLGIWRTGIDKSLTLERKIESRKRNFSLDLENLIVSISLSTLDFQRILESEEYEKFEKRPFVIAHDKH